MSVGKLKGSCCVGDVESPTDSRQCTNHLKFQGLGLLPAEVLVGEMSVLSGLEVDWLGQVELLDYDTRSEIEVGIYNLD